MRVRSPLHSIDVRGRFAVGPVFSIWRGLNYARIFTVPVNPSTSRQLEIRGLMTDASRGWALITDAQRAAFEVYADGMNRKNVFGQDLKTTGFNEYVALFVLASDVGETPVSDAPVTDAPALVTDGAIATGATDGIIDITWTAGQGGFMDAWITPVLGAGRQPQKSDYTHLSYTADVTATLEISGLVVAGKYGVKIRQVALDGQVGPWLQSTLLAGET